MDIYTIKKSTIQSITDSLRNKTGAVDIIKTKNIPDYINIHLASQGKVEELNDEINSIIEGTITSIYNTTATEVRANAFNGCTSLSNVTFTEASIIGSNAFSSCNNLIYLSIPKATTINANAFSGCTALEEVCAGVSEIYSTDAIGVNLIKNTNLKRISFPNCTIMYSSVCQGATALTDVYLPNVSTTQQYQFYGCSSLEEIDLPQADKAAASCFENCINLQKVSMPLMTSVLARGFYNCSNLKELYAPLLTSYSTTPFGTAGVSTSGGHLTWESVTAGFTTVPALWSNQSNLTYVSMSNATAVAANAFKNCVSLSNIYNIGNVSKPTLRNYARATFYYIYNSQTGSRSTVTLIASITDTFYASNITFNQSAFENTGIKQLNLKENVIVPSRANFTSGGRVYYLQGYNVINSQAYMNFINNRKNYSKGTITMGIKAFANNSNLTTVDIQQPCSLNYNAFYNCTALSKVNLSDVTYWSVYSGTHPLNSCTALKNITFSGTLTTIPQSAFQNLTALTSATLPDASIIGINAFQKCSALTKVNIPKVEKLYTNAFAYCSTLSTITLSNINNISATAFGSCTALTSLYLTCSSIPTLANVNAFTNTPLSISTLTGDFGSIYVPSSLYDSYITATNWSKYSARFVSIEE